MSRTFITSDGVSADVLQKNPNFLLDNYILEGKTIPIHLFGDNTATAIDDAITYLTNAGGGRVHIPANGTNFELEIRVFKDRNGTYHTNFEYNYDRYPTTEARPYTSENWQIGDIIRNNNPTNEEYEGWICSAAGTPGTWVPFGYARRIANDLTQVKHQVNEIESDISDIKSGTIQQTPLFANSIEECTDTTKVYVLPDGYIYGYNYIEKTVYPYTNLADPTSSDWLDGYRITSSGPAAQAGKTTTNLIQWDVGDVIRVTGISGFITNNDRICDTPNNTGAGNYAYVSTLPTDYFGYEVIDGVHTFTLLKRTDNNCKYFRCCFNTPTDPSTVIITKNEEITEGTVVKEYAWGNTGHAFVPADYEDRIVELESGATSLSNRVVELESGATSLSNRISENTANITQLDERLDIIESGNASSVPTFWQSAITSAKEKILAKHNLGGAGCVSFVLTSDIHASVGIDEKGKRFGIVAKAIMDEADIPLFVSTGDLMSQSSHADVSNVYAELALVKSWLEPIPFYQQALVMGNHDGAWGDTTSGYYYKQLPLEIVYNQIYRKQAMDLRRVSGDNGTYYYLDNESQKMRYIMLNSHNTPSYAENEDGTAVYDRFHTDCMCQDQYDWLTNVALDMPDGYTACLFMHSPYPGGWQLMVGIVDAYNSKSTYNNSFTDSENTWRNSTVNVDFSNANGTIAGVFAGHTHIDAIRHVGNNPMYLTCPLIITPNSVGGAVKDGTTRTDGTDTEFVMDIVTVDTKNRNIYITRLGAGNDREISY